MGPYQRTPKKVTRAIKYPGLGVRSVGPVGDFLDSPPSFCLANFSSFTLFYPNRTPTGSVRLKSLRSYEVPSEMQWPRVESSLKNSKIRVAWAQRNELILLMEEIRRSPVEVGSLSHYLQGFIHPRWCRISSINSKSRVKNEKLPGHD